MDLLQWSKIFALFLYFPIYCGVIIWAYASWNRERMDSYRYIPLRED